MTRYLDRAPRTHDRVRVEYEGEYRLIGRPGSHEHGVWAGNSVGAMSAYVVPDTATIRVIAPEPKVGDVVTADMDLPEGTIIETQDGQGIVSRKADRWAGHFGADSTPIFERGLWRIVRIGAAS